ncbi:MAG TPA: polyprenyl synthetase family protein [Gemmatimonadales bacterium]|nr:polyprenyl synthetase family protein [Gemmatimonadales bacterium]
MGHSAPPISTPDSAALAAAMLGEARDRVDARLEAWALRLERRRPGPDGAALAYALRSPGKRVRAALVLAAYRAFGGRSEGIDGVAAAVETVHAYSLVHDDLPCMDDDDLRRGRPTTHRAFDVVTATRAGLLLVPVAAEVLGEAASDLELGPAELGHMARVLFEAGGVNGMVGGQWLDLEAERRRLDHGDLMAVHRGKTGALIEASCVLGALAARAAEADVVIVAGFGADIGLAFQIADDVLDATATSEVLGKTAGKDTALEKSTYVSVLGVERARAEAEALAGKAVARLRDGGCESTALAALANYIVSRTS